MSATEIYPQLSLQDQQNQYISNLINDQDWLIHQIIVPKLPSLITTVRSVLFYLLLDKPFKLPITSNSNDYLKGVITRNSFKISSLSLQINKLSFFNNANPFKISLDDDKQLELIQIKMMIKRLEFLVLQLDNVVKFIRAMKQQPTENINIKLKNNLIFLKKFNQIFQNILLISGEIDNPVQSSLFPENHLDPQNFKPELDLNKLSIDLYLNSGEIFIELIFLKKINIKPWCFINKYGISFNEFLTKKFVQNRKFNNINHLIEHYLEEKNWPKFWEFDDSANSDRRSITSSSSSSATKHNDNRLSPNINKESAESHNSWFKNILNFQNSSEVNQMYLNRNLKFNNAIYWILKNLQVKIADPILIIVNIKLNSIRALVQNNLLNLKNLIVNGDYLKSVIEKQPSFTRLEQAKDEETYNLLVNQFFSNKNQDIIDQESSFDLVEYLKSGDDSELNSLVDEGTFNPNSNSRKSNHENLDTLGVNFELLKDIHPEYEMFNDNLEEWDGELIKEISSLINNDPSNTTVNDAFSCCEFDVFDA
ncbi:hypothetical protein DASC09_055320 [Saccharomycopsis crataegensis]|uniref:Uncharacterized protein n=1 Tax=Saccharomycopsis crataegensis TaxID=43959 RepID=A0AAV5QTF1_9ASCO|nr:hypothetical protein DASC09_055320 [Saccharomycopsis crataegensis]